MLFGVVDHVRDQYKLEQHYGPQSLPFSHPRRQQHRDDRLWI